MIELMLICIAVIATVTWGVVQCVQIHKYYKERERQLDEWYERELAWLEEMMKDEDDD